MSQNEGFRCSIRKFRATGYMFIQFGIYSTDFVGTEAMLALIRFSDSLICCYEKLAVYMVVWVAICSSKEWYLYSFYY